MQRIFSISSDTDVNRSFYTDAECSSISETPFYRCASCPLGFKMNMNGTYCEDIDEVYIEHSIKQIVAMEFC